MSDTRKRSRRRPVLTAMRLTEAERVMVDTAADLDRATVNDLLRRIVIPAVCERVSRSAVELGGQKVGT